MTKNINYTIQGYGGDTGTVSIPVADATADDALDTMVGNLTRGNPSKRSVTAGATNLGGVPPVDVNAQIEQGIRFYWSDDVTGRTGYFTVPAPDLPNLTLSGNEFSLTSADAVQTFVDWYNINGETPIDGNAATISAARYVSR